MTWLRNVRRQLQQFLFPFESDDWLAYLRIGLACQIICYCFALRGDWIQLFAGEGNGLISRDLTEASLAAESPYIPAVGWLVSLGGYLGIGETEILWLVWFCLLSGALCLLAGIFSRIATVLLWFLYLCTTKSASLLGYGVDNFTVIGLFYLMVSPLPDRWALDARWRDQPPKDPRLHGFHRRILQLHMCLIYFFGGIAKSVGVGWWTGTSLWRAMTRAPFDVIPPELLIRGKSLFAMVGILVCMTETAYPIFIWWRKTRPVWLLLVVGMHVAIGVAMGMYLFALVMLVLNIAAFGPDWRRVFGCAATEDQIAEKLPAAVPLRGPPD